MVISKTGGGMIEIKKLSFSYPNGFLALGDVTLILNEGDFILLTGANGSGKTTLAKQLNGLLSPSEGTVLFDGNTISGVPTSVIAKDVGFVFQNPDHQLHKPTVREEMGFSLRNFGFEKREIDRRVGEIARELDLVGLLESSPQELTSSQKKLLTIASVLVYEPRVLIIDEATANLDRVHTEKIVRILESYHRPDRLILTISHNIPMWAESKALNRVIVMEEGRIIDDAPPRHVLTSDEVMGRLTDGVLPVTTIARTLGTWGIGQDIYSVREMENRLLTLLGDADG
jgi:energy-coupling factor transporter ATP-binding protein EcfA2